MKHKVYIDGQAGTTGLQLRQKLQNHKDVEILLISEELRKDEASEKDCERGRGCFSLSAG